jgi:hypothetical protein
MLPEPIEATVGKVFHRARELILGEVAALEGPNDLVDRALGAALIGVVPDGTSPSAAREALQLELGRCRWIDRVDDLRRWAAALQRPDGAPLRGPRTPTGDAPGPQEHRPNEISFGAERTWTCNELRLRGRPDESTKDAGQVVEVRDYKSSASAFFDGPAHDAAEVQMRLYLLMAEVLTGQMARGFLVGQDVARVSWDASARDALRARVEAACTSFAAGEEVGAEQLARPGSHCRRCAHRPGCASYLSQTPEWWRDTGSPPRPLPLDVWGGVERLEQEPDGVCVWLRDAAGRLVVVRGLAPAWQLDSLAGSATVYFFGLEATEDLVVHGRRVHPSAFHESTRAAGRRSARRLRVFAA